MKQKAKKFWIWTAVVSFASATLASSILLSKNITHHQEQMNRQSEEIRNTLTQTKANEDDWNIEKLNYIQNNLNYYDQYRVSDLSTLFKTTQQDNEQYIYKVTSASKLGNLDVTTHYTNFDKVQLIGLTNMIDQFKSVYSQRYSTSNVQSTAWSSLEVEKTKYYTKNLNPENKQFYNKYQEVENIPYFTTKSVIAPAGATKDQLYIHDMYDLKKIDLTRRGDITNQENDIFPDNKFYKVSTSAYIQYSADTSNLENKYQIVVDWRERPLPGDERKSLIDVSTEGFWTKILMHERFSEFSRIVVKPANLIIYKSSVQNPIDAIPLSETTLKKLVKNNVNEVISFDNWADSCINDNPAADFDFREALTRNGGINRISRINIPKIVTLDLTDKSGNYTRREPTKIPSGMLYAQKPMGNHNREWGNNYFPELKDLIVSMSTEAPNGSKTQGFHIAQVNDTRLASDYTNALVNTDNQNTNESGIFANQFFVAPKLETYTTNYIDDFFNNFNFINQLPIYYKYNEPNFSIASYNRYKQLAVNFAPEAWNINPVNSNPLSSFNGFTLRDSILNSDDLFNDKAKHQSTITNYLDEYFNFFRKNRDTKDYRYQYYTVDQNQWKAILPDIEIANNINSRLISSKGQYRFDFMYGVSDLLQHIAYPFSMFPDILNEANSMYLENDYYVSSYGKHISRFVDPTTATIVYSNKFVTNNNALAVYPPKELNNDYFSNFVEAKIKEVSLAPDNKYHINLTFDDWANHGWTGLDSTLDIVRVLAQKNAVIDHLEIPKIIMVNNNTITNLIRYSVDNDLVISIVLIGAIIVAVLIEIFLIIKIIRTPGYYKWSLIQAQESTGF